MTPQQLQAEATQNAQQGQQQYNSDLSQVAPSQQNYANYSNQANQATSQAQSLANYMQGAGSGLSTYNSELPAMEAQAGYNPQNQNRATASLYGLNGALQGANQQFNGGGLNMGGFGSASAGALGSYENTVLGGLQAGVNNANTQVGQGNTAFANAETGANQATTANVQTEQARLTGLNAAAANYQTQAASALQNAQFYSQLAQTQGVSNAQSQQYYTAATQSLAQANELGKQAAYLQSQTVGQGLINQSQQDQLNANAAKVKQQNIDIANNTKAKDARAATSQLKASQYVAPSQYLAPSNVASTLQNALGGNTGNGLWSQLVRKAI
jgi:hypothetical protein